MNLMDDIIGCHSNGRLQQLASHLQVWYAPTRKEHNRHEAGGKPLQLPIGKAVDNVVYQCYT